MSEDLVSSPTRRTLARLPVETLTEVAARLDYEDLARLKQCSIDLSQSLHNEGLHRSSVQRYTSYTHEAMEAATGSVPYLTAHARISDRRARFASAQPHTLTFSGNADDFAYQDGILAYITNGSMRLSDIHRNPNVEFAADIRDLQDATNSILESSEMEEDESLSLLTFPCAAVLVQLGAENSKIQDISRKEVQNHEDCGPEYLADISASHSWFKLSGDYLVKGEHNGIGEDSHREWVITTHSRSDALGTFQPHGSVQFQRFFGIDVGQNVIFEIFDDHLYAVSNLSSPHAEEITWTSYYHCFRLPLDDPKQENLQYEELWRRQHREGPINDSWTSLSLQRDEGSGKVTICEARREWKNASSTQERTFYFQPLGFPDRSGFKSDEESGDEEMQGDDSTTSNPASSPHPSDASDTYPNSSKLPNSSPPGNSDPANPSPSRYPANDPLVPAIDDTNKPLYEEARYRLPRNYHPEFPPSPPSSTAPHHRQRKPPHQQPPTYILTNTKHRSYNLSASSFLDVILEDNPLQPFNTTQLRLRIGSRSLAPPLDDSTGLLRTPLTDPKTGNPIPGSEEHFRDHGVKLWPPKDAPEELLQMLRIKGTLRSRVEAVADERSVVLAMPTGQGEEKRLVVVNFDGGGIWFEGLEEMILPSSGAASGDGDYPGILARDISIPVQNSIRGGSMGVSPRKVDPKGKKRANDPSNDDDNNEQDEDAFKGGKKAKTQAHAGSDDEDEDINMADDAEQDLHTHTHTRGQWVRTEPAQWRGMEKKGFRFVYR